MQEAARSGISRILELGAVSEEFRGPRRDLPLRGSEDGATHPAAREMDVGRVPRTYLAHDRFSFFVHPTGPPAPRTGAVRRKRSVVAGRTTSPRRGRHLTELTI